MDLGLLLVSRACSKEELPVEKKKKESEDKLVQVAKFCVCLSLYLTLITFRE